MTLNIALETEQANREQQGKSAYEAEANKETELYTAGDFDGGIGVATHNKNHSDPQ